MSLNYYIKDLKAQLLAHVLHQRRLREKFNSQYIIFQPIDQKKNENKHRQKQEFHSVLWEKGKHALVMHAISILCTA